MESFSLLLGADNRASLTEGNSMKTYSRLTLAFLLLILVVPQVGADEPPENGPYVEYYDDGKKRSEAHYKNGVPDGLGTYWYEGGQKIEEGQFKNGKKDGLWTSWYENGQKWTENHWKDGKLDGLETHWHENGQKSYEGHNKNGVPDGLWPFWDKNGEAVNPLF
jgi:hypothetical protein